MIDYFIQNWDEVLGTLLGLIYIGCSIMGRKELWIFGLLNSALYILVFYRTKFYADMTLQVYYVAVSIYGLYYWLKGGKSDQGKEELPIKRSRPKDWFWVVVGTLAVWAVYYFCWLRYTDDAFPISDACTTALCIVATWMLARKMLDNWLLFIVADALTCYLYSLKGIYFAAFLMGVYTLLAIVGYFRWRRSLS